MSAIKHNNMKQTAVEWLFLMLNNPNKDQEFAKKLLDKAKEMEKEQIINSRENGFLWGMRSTNNFYADKVIESEQYYKETYESKTNI